jgi:hypothetical protein
MWMTNQPGSREHLDRIQPLHVRKSIFLNLREFIIKQIETINKIKLSNLEL